MGFQKRLGVKQGPGYIGLLAYGVRAHHFAPLLLTRAQNFRGRGSLNLASSPSGFGILAWRLG